MSEKGFRSQVVQALKPLDARAVENRVGPGTPDVNYADGWIELKWKKSWPKIKPDAIVLCEHYTPQQRVWMARRVSRGGNAFLFAKFGPDYILLPGLWATVHFGRCTKADLFNNCRATWHGKLNAKELIQCLRS